MTIFRAIQSDAALSDTLCMQTFKTTVTIVAKLALKDLKLGTILDMEQNCNEIAGVSINLIDTSARIHY